MFVVPSNDTVICKGGRAVGGGPKRKGLRFLKVHRRRTLSYWRMRRPCVVCPYYRIHIRFTLVQVASARTDGLSAISQLCVARRCAAAGGEENLPIRYIQ